MLIIGQTEHLLESDWLLEVFEAWEFSRTQMSNIRRPNYFQWGVKASRLKHYDIGFLISRLQQKYV